MQELRINNLINHYNLSLSCTRERLFNFFNKYYEEFQVRA